MPFTLGVLQIKKRTPILSLFVVFTFGFTIESIKEFGVHQQNNLS
jgi:hypothetical protein